MIAEFSATNKHPVIDYTNLLEDDDFLDHLASFYGVCRKSMQALMDISRKFLQKDIFGLGVARTWGGRAPSVSFLGQTLGLSYSIRGYG